MGTNANRFDQQRHYEGSALSSNDRNVGGENVMQMGVGDLMAAANSIRDLLLAPERAKQEAEKQKILHIRAKAEEKRQKKEEKEEKKAKERERKAKAKEAKVQEKEAKAKEKAAKAKPKMGDLLRQKGPQRAT